MDHWGGEVNNLKNIDNVAIHKLVIGFYLSAMFKKLF